MTQPAPAIQAAFTQQIGWCERLGSPFTAALLRHLAADHAAGGVMAGLIGAWPGDPVADALPLRCAGALHACVLSGSAPALAACFPPNPLELGALAGALRLALAANEGTIRRFLASPPQTNEVGRSGVLLGGFLAVAHATGLPLRLLEIGSSAGLNLHWDRYRYQLGSTEWGDLASPVRLAPTWDGPSPAPAALTVASRAGCDLAPVDLEQAEQRLRLRAYVWPDQAARLARLDAAIGLARAAGVSLARADAAEWVAGQLAQPVPAQATVLFHSIMWQYLPEPTQRSVRASLEQAGAAATPAAPLAWLRFEPPHAEARPELTLQIWPGLPETRLAVAHPHGTAVTWLTHSSTAVPPALEPL